MREYYGQTNKSEVKVIKAISNNFCNRCLSDKFVIDVYGRLNCPDCHAVEGETLFRIERQVENREHVMKFPFELSQEQKTGSEFVLRLIKNHQNGILHAVCGAGKTEMTYDGLLYALGHEMRICFAIPRKEIVIELAKRFKTYFPSTIIKAMHQDNKDDEGAHLVISTVHQLINYYHEFDLVILDEADAFPYAGNVYLQRLVHKALREDGILIQMSATFEHNFGRIASANYHLSPSRFHNGDLDEPQFIQVEDIHTMLNSHKIPRTIGQILDRWVNNNLVVFMFVPTISIGHNLARIMKQSGYRSENISSKSLDKDIRLKNFQRGQTEILITTTILERGVTFKNVQVGVLFADDRIFTKSVLIQICGRVGRFRDYPSGEICFFSEYVSKAMIEAKKEIRKFNKMKRERL